MANDGGDHHLGSRKDGSDLATARAVAKIADLPADHHRQKLKRIYAINSNQ
jgi:hypothetical protein